MRSRKGNSQSSWVKWGSPHFFFFIFHIWLGDITSCFSLSHYLINMHFYSRCFLRVSLGLLENSQTAKRLWARDCWFQGQSIGIGIGIVLPIISDFVQSKYFTNANWMNLKRKNSRGEQQKWHITNIHSFHKDLLKFLHCQHWRNSKQYRKFLPLNSSHSTWSRRNVYIWFIFS